MRHFTLLPHRRTRHHRRSRHGGPESLKRDPVHAAPWPRVGRFPLRGVPRLLTTPGQTWWIPCRTNFIRKDSGCWCNLNLEIISPGSRTRDFTVICRYNYRYAVSAFINRAHNLKEAEIRQPWVVNGYNAHTPDSRKACQAIAFYDNFTPEKSRPIKIEPLSIEWILLHKRHRKNSRRIPSISRKIKR